MKAEAVEGKRSAVMRVTALVSTMNDEWISRTLTEAITRAVKTHDISEGSYETINKPYEITITESDAHGITIRPQRLEDDGTLVEVPESSLSVKILVEYDEVDRRPEIL